jgi:hypothetical protein
MRSIGTCKKIIAGGLLSAAVAGGLGLTSVTTAAPFVIDRNNCQQILGMFCPTA